MPIRIAAERPRSAAAEGGAGREGIFHELQVRALAVGGTGKDRERCGDQPAHNTRAVGEPAEHGGALVIAE